MNPDHRAAVSTKKALTCPDGACTRIAELCRGLAHPLRVRIVAMLASADTESPCICSDIVKALPLAQSSVSQHLRTLKETGWITGKPSGTRVEYCLNEGVVEELMDLLDGMSTQMRDDGRGDETRPAQ